MVNFIISVDPTKNSVNIGDFLAHLSNQRILITGGTGYIGSHAALCLLEAGCSVVLYDNYSNSSPKVVDRLSQIAGQPVPCVEGDIRDAETLHQTFQRYSITSVLHFAGLKAVGESQSFPLSYYDHNVSGTLTLLKTMMQAKVHTLVFSSSATVYGNPGYPQYHEQTPLHPVNVYGRTKRTIEMMLTDLKNASPFWKIGILRYFNPVGAHVSGLIGEDPKGIPNNLMPFIGQVALGLQPKLLIYGNDYPTKDGTGMRDYIHVEDLAQGHLAALTTLVSGKSSFFTANLGTGHPHSVLDVVRAFEQATGRALPYEIVARRPGDLSEYYADPSLANTLLEWEARYNIYRACVDSWRWLTQ